jgi:hypothetical protein
VSFPFLQAHNIPVNPFKKEVFENDFYIPDPKCLSAKKGENRTFAYPHLPLHLLCSPLKPEVEFLSFTLFVHHFSTNGNKYLNILSPQSAHVFKP